MPMRDLLVLFFDLIDFRDIDKCQIFLPIDSLKFQAFVDGCAIDDIHFFFDEWQFDCLLGLALLHEYIIDNLRKMKL